MLTINTVEQYIALTDEQKNTIMFTIHGVLFEDRQTPNEVIYYDENEENENIESVNYILNKWLRLNIALGQNSIQMLLRVNGELD
jgi:hypothetical protein